MKPLPPRIATRFLQWFCPPQLLESIEGDLEQQFEDDLALGRRRANWRFVLNVIRFFRPEIIARNQFSPRIINTIMLANYIKVAARNVQRRKFYAFINAFGLSIGIAFCILIYLYIEDERSFDQFHVNKEVLYRLEENTYDTWQQDPQKPYNRTAYLPLAMMAAVKAEIPEVEYAAHFTSGGSGAFQYGEKVFTERFVFTEADFFKMFSFRLLAGSADRIFKTKDEVVITPEIARKYFGDEDPIGKTISLFIEAPRQLTVTGLIEAPPGNSSLNFKVLVPMENHPHFEHNLKQWGNFSFPTFIQLSPKADPAALPAKFEQVVTKYMGDRLERWRKNGKVPDNVKMFELLTTRLTDMHLNTEVTWDKVSDPQYSYILGGIALLILAIACINYVSLALTTSTSRRVEVGIRKVVGAQRNQLIYQFGFESILLALLSMVLAMGVVVLFLPYFNDFTGKKIEVDTMMAIKILAAAVITSTIVGIFAGAYPSFFLSRFRPSAVLKGGFTSRLQAGFTKPLVVLQFAMSAMLIISSIVMYRQMQYITTKDLGYDQEQILVIPTQAGWSEESNQVVQNFRNRLAQESSIVSVAGTTSSFNQGYSRYGFTVNGEQKAAYVYAIDPYYLPTLGIQLAMGRNFDPARTTDTTSLIVNEALVKDLGLKDPLNEYVNWREDTVGPGYKIIGVVKDYHFLSLQQNIEPMFLSIDKKEIGYLTTMLVKVKAGDMQGTIDRIRSAWKEMYPDRPFDHSFLDEDVASAYERHKRWMKIMGLATAFGILIACLGLFGLSGINAVNRTKEIGIRKVMGANLSHIFVLLNRQYVILALIAFAIATPLSYYAMNIWLAEFKFRIELGWPLFVTSIFAGLIIALVTVSYHTLKAGNLNPAETLKYE